MYRYGQLLLSITCGALFAWLVPASALVSATTTSIPALAIIGAAVFVRLNRGMPALDWKSIDPKRRKDVTNSIYRVSREYAGLLVVIGFLLLLFILLSALGPQGVCELAGPFKRALAGLAGFLACFVVLRTGYVIWRDLDIVKLQKHVIDEAATKEISEAAEAEAKRRLDAMNAGRHPQPPVAPPISAFDV